MIFINKVELPTVLLVDADLEQSLGSKSELEAQGYNVVCVYSGEEAFATFARKRFDAIVVEPFLPDMHVLDFVDEIAAKRDHKIPIIINDACPGHRQDFRYWAADAILDKTNAAQKLFSQVAALL
jgi:DNA-binding response OmpR family regulator